MARDYTKQEILKKCEDSSADIAEFYKQPFANYRGTTSDTGELYTEVIAQWCLDNIALFNGIETITRTSSYDQNHDGKTDRDSSSRNEERIAMDLFNQSQSAGGVGAIGEVIDYQTPLKDKRNDHAGKIDILSYSGDTLYVLELKDEDSEESMLRCVLEGYTYLRTADMEKLASDFMATRKLKNKPKRVTTAPLVFDGGYQHAMMREDMPNLRRLMSELCDGYFCISAEKPYVVTRG